VTIGRDERTGGWQPFWATEEAEKRNNNENDKKANGQGDEDADSVHHSGGHVM
jgi:hypothetical protein